MIGGVGPGGVSEVAVFDAGGVAAPAKSTTATRSGSAAAGIAFGGVRTGELDVALTIELETDSLEPPVSRRPCATRGHAKVQGRKSGGWKTTDGENWARKSPVSAKPGRSKGHDQNQRSSPGTVSLSFTAVSRYRSLETPVTTFCCTCNKRLSRASSATVGLTVQFHTFQFPVLV